MLYLHSTLATDNLKPYRQSNHVTNVAVTESTQSVERLQLNPKNFSLSYRNKEVYLRAKHYCLAKILFERQGELVSRETLIAETWGEQTHYGKAGLGHAMHHLRKALSELGCRQQLLETIPKRGYRLNFG